MVQGHPIAEGGTCRHCGTGLRANAPFCGSCGQAVVNRVRQHPVQLTQPRPIPAAAGTTALPDHTVGAHRGLRCASHLMDLAVMLSPALPLAIAAAVLGVAEIVYAVVPIAFVCVWLWMQIWQGYTGMTFGKSMLGLRLVRAADNHPPGLAKCISRGVIFGATAGLAALPVVTSAVPHDGLHDRVAGLTMIDVVSGVNPLGRKQDSVFRRSVDRSLNKVAAPLPVTMPGRG